MKIVSSLAGLLAAATLSAFGSDAVTYVSASKVTAAFGKGGNLAQGDAFAVQTSRRDKAGNPEAHAQDDEIMYVVDGEATVVTGGTMIGGKVGKNGNSSGTSVEGGDSHHLAKGDVLVVPRGTPHWFKEVPTAINYYVVKVHAPAGK